MRNLILEGVKSFASCTIWTRNQEHLLRTYLSSFDETTGKIHAWIPKEFDVSKFIHDVKIKPIQESRLSDPSDMPTPDCYFSVSLATANIFFKALFDGVDGEGLRFFAPTNVYKVQRRKDFRMPIPDGYAVIAEFNDPIFEERRLKKKIMDVSAGGLAFIVEEDEAPMFTIGMMIPNIEFKIKSRKIVATGEVRHMRTIAPQGTATAGAKSRLKGVKVGVQFKHIAERDIQFIAAYVFEESRKYFTKLI